MVDFRMNSYVTELQPLLLVMRAFGWFPLCTQANGTSLELRMRSGIFMYSAVLNVLLFVLWIILTAHAFETIPQLDSSLQLLGFCYMFSLTLPLVLSPMAALQSISHLALCKEWGSFQARFERVTHETLHFELHRLSTGCLITCFVCSALMSVQRVVIQGQLPSLADMIFNLSVVISVVLVIWWFIACRALALASTHLLQQYKMLSALRDARTPALAFQPLWLQLRRLLLLTGEAMSMAQGALLAYNLVLLLTCSYQVIMWDNLVTKSFFALFGAAAMAEFVLTCHSGHAANNTIHQSILEAMKITKGFKMSVKIEHQVLSLLSNVARNLPRISWSGYLGIDRGLLSSCLAAVFTNLVVLVQLGIRQTATFTILEMFAFSEILTKF